ncbi:hypothetical protein HS088_TW03G00255 [Tripterygium wilfordii]|uniref:Uncharacterized protein n=1 Tax=Tripterygium wilfordii TaxID=458696 RepID=A0A7J7DU74_TRIWF|nr:uncharacterized protein LOC119984093 [Tripterygium wilfordii]KAF5749928.1 hypothetical protein HS088_TW03G00255 [Tripterygium wilfordii]
MFGFGDEFMIDSYRRPWLLWIQLLVLFLLLFLLYCFTVFTSDLSDDATTATATASASRSSMSNLGKPIVNKHGSTAVTSHRQNFQVGEIQSMKGEIATRMSRRMVRGDIAEREGSPVKNATLLFLHPCHYFRLARWAFLKCFGIDANSENSTTGENRKDR